MIIMVRIDIWLERQTDYCDFCLLIYIILQISMVVFGGEPLEW